MFGSSFVGMSSGIVTYPRPRRAGAAPQAYYLIRRARKELFEQAVKQAHMYEPPGALEVRVLQAQVAALSRVVAEGG